MAVNLTPGALGYPGSIEQLGNDVANQQDQTQSKYAGALASNAQDPVSNSPFVVPVSLDDYFQTTPVGSVNKAIGNNMFGMNHQQVPSMVSTNWDLHGLTFFTRPQLNLQSDNIRNVRQLSALMNGAQESIQKFVRLSLDPRLQHGYDPLNLQVTTNMTSAMAFADKYRNSGIIPTNMVDPFMSFIPILTNNITAISGWPDLVAPTFTSEKGLYNQAYSQVDGSVKYYETFDMDVTFRNSRGDPIVYMFYVWLWYMSMVFEGYLVPYPDFIAENELDYCTRIYRLVLDSTRTYVKKIAATGASFPVSLPMNSFFEFSTEKPYNEQNKDITIRFRSNGVTYMDDILIFEFNKTVGIFQPGINGLYDGTGRTNGLIRVDKSLLQFFNNRGYPFIDPNTYELQWYVDALTYQQKLSLLQSVKAYNPNQNDSNHQVIPPQPYVVG